MSLIQFQNLEKEAFQNASLAKALFRNGNKGYSCLWATSFCNLGTTCIMRTNHAHIICTPRGPPFGITKDFAAKLLQ